MNNFFKSLKIRAKLLAAFGSILLLSVFLIFFSISSINTMLRHKEANEQVDLLKLNFETLNLHAKKFMYEGFKSDDFLQHKKDASIVAFNENYQNSKDLIAQMSSSDFLRNKENKNLLNDIRITLDSIQKEFNMLVDLLQERGFKDYGSEGKLRSAIHQLENSGFAFDKASMLMLRRHEKDFFLRKDLKYQADFNARLAEFRMQLTNDPGLTGLVSYLDNYQKEFNNVVAIEKTIGLTEREGIRGRIRTYFNYIRPRLDEFRIHIKEKNETQILRTKIILGVLFSIQIIAGLIMALVYANLLTKSIKEIRNGMQKLARGIFPEKLPVRTTEEIGQTKQAFNQFVDRLHAATTFAERLGAGDERVDYDQRFSDDVLAVSLIGAHRKLVDAHQRQERINWANRGAAALGDILKNESDPINILADKILKLLVTYLNANQGALYCCIRPQTEEAYLERVATYAYGKKKFETHRIPFGEGIIGQCVLEGSPTYLRDVPKNFVKINSGLGEATPRNVLITPLKSNQLVMGAVELASFTYFETHQIEFVERIAENIATILSNKQRAEETRTLLAESQERANVLMHQEEALRQNAEELQATQDEMERQRRELQHEINLLREKLKQATAHAQQYGNEVLLEQNLNLVN